MSNIHFVHDNEPGTPLDNEQIRALRSHVRKVNLERLQQRTTERMENFRSLSVNDFSEHGEIKPDKRRFPVRAERIESGAPSSNATESNEGPSAQSVSTLDASEGLESLSGPSGEAWSLVGQVHTGQPAAGDSILGSTTTQHPYSAQISAVTGIDEALVDRLLRSGALRIAAEPLFTAEHQTPDLVNLSIFPSLLQNQAFLSALVYSMLQTQDSSAPANESLHFKGTAIEFLQDDLHRNGSTRWTLSICTILLLCAAAHRSGEIAEYTAHAEGLGRLVRLCHSSQVSLPSDVLRAVFWHDLTGAGILGDKRRFSEADFPTLFHMDMTTILGTHETLPYGFAFHRDVIHHDLFPCIERIRDLQTSMATGAVEPIKVDNVRASIISRLVFLQPACQAFGPISEGCRIAAYLVCYTCIKGPGKSSFVSLRLSHSLGSILDDTDCSEAWAYRRDLLLWLVFVGASASRTERWSVSPGDSLYEGIMARLLRNARNWVEQEEGTLIFLTAVQGYIYEQDWINKRHLIPHWTDLEKLLMRSGLLNAGASET